MSQPKIILVAGPTASGKSAFALDLAHKNNGTIINADAMQVYEGLPILSSQPSATDQKAVPHELYGIVNPHEASSAGKWLALAIPAVERAIAAGRTPILVGGTGLYFRAFLTGLADIPPIPDEVRQAAQQLYDELGEENFRRELAKLDLASATKLARNDRQRLIRAYEVARHTGKALSEWHKKGSGVEGSGLENILLPTPNPKLLTPETHLLMPEREALYAACNQRFQTMMDNGALVEVEQFLERHVSPDLPAAKTIGVPELTAFLRGEVSREDAIAAAQQATRNYAKRQMTWFRNQWKSHT